jgi:N-methylhydantoinase A
VTGTMRKPLQEKLRRGTSAPPRAAFTGKRPASFGGGRFVATPTWRRGALLAGNEIRGPALIEEHASTTVLMPRDKLKVDAYGNLIVTVGGG